MTSREKQTLPKGSAHPAAPQGFAEKNGQSHGHQAQEYDATVDHESTEIPTSETASDANQQRDTAEVMVEQGKHGAEASFVNGTKPQPRSPRAQKRTFMERVETRLSELSSRSNFWHRVCSWIWLPFAYRSGIRFRRDGHTFAAVLPFRRFNRNWYSAMAGAALLGNSEIAGGMFVFQECGGNYRVVCKELNYKFMRPCVGPALYRMTPREDIKAQAELGHEFNVTLDMEVVQVMRAPKEDRERRVGRCTAVFHVTPQNHGRDTHRRKGRKYNRK